jgi:hypothetical protein
VDHRAQASGSDAVLRTAMPGDDGRRGSAKHAFFALAALCVRVVPKSWLRKQGMPSDSHAFVWCAASVHRILRPTSVTIAIRCPRHCEERKRRPAVARFASYGALGVRRSVLTRRRKQSRILPSRR